MPGIAYLGPEGTFTEAALRALAANGLIPSGGEPVTPIPAESTVAALAAVRAGEADFACVPIENSIDGSVIPTLGVTRQYRIVEYRGIEPQEYDPLRIVFRLDAAGNIQAVDCG